MLRRHVTFFSGFLLASLIALPAARAEVSVPCVPPAEEPSAANTAVPPEQPEQEIPYAISPYLNELFPDPEGDDTAGEFLELHNAGAESIDLAGWRISDAKGNDFVFENTSLGAGAHLYITYAETKLRQTNTGGTFSLVDPAGTIRDSVTYVSPVPVGKAYAKISGIWKWVSATPGEINFDDTPAPPPAPVPESSPSETYAEPAAPVPQETIFADGRVTISALLPNPDGDDAGEWVELRNDAPEEKSLAGWSLEDLAQVTYALDDIRIPALGTMRIMKSSSRISLNNTEEELRLRGPNGSVRDSVRYEDAPSGVAYTKTADGAWRWADASNDAAPDAENESNATEGEKPVEDVTGIGLPELSTFNDGETAIVDAAITLAPGIVGKSVFAIRDPEAEIGGFVRMYGSGPYPALEHGDSVRIVGRVKTSGTMRLATTAREVTRIGTSPRVPPFDVMVADVGTDFSGLELTVSGRVTRRAKRSLSISDDAGSEEIVARLMTGETPMLTQGDRVSVTGVVRSVANGIEIIVTDPALIVATRQNAENDAALANEAIGETSGAERSAPLDFSVIAPRISPDALMTSGAILVACILGYGIWRRRLSALSETDSA